MGIPIEAPPDRPGHAGWTAQPQRDLGLSLGRLHDLAGGLFGSGIVRALVGLPESAGTLGAEPLQEYALQPFGVPGSQDPSAPKPAAAAKASLAAHAHTVLALEEAAIKFGRSDRTDNTVPQDLQDALNAAQTWQAPR